MLRYTVKRALMVLFVCLVALGFTPGSAQAEAPSTTVTSSNDASQQFEYTTAAAECDDITKDDAWTSPVGIANFSGTKSLTVSVEENKGETIDPSGFGTVYVHGNGNTAANVTLNFTFEGLGAESTNFMVTAPEYGCQGKGGGDTPDDVNCTLLNFTGQSAYDEKNGTYAVGTVIKLETLVSGADAGKVAQYVFDGNFNNGQYSVLQRSASNKYELLLDKPGSWTVNVLLEDSNGQTLHVNRAANCTVYLDSASASEVTPPGTDEPTGTTDDTIVTPVDTTVTPTTSNSGNGSSVLATSGENAAPATELPATGARMTFAFLLSLVLLTTGGLLCKFGRPRKQPLTTC